MITILVVEDHPAYGAALTSFLSAEKDLVVLALAGNGETAIAFAAEWQPAVVLIDLVLPGMSGLDATRRILSVAPDSHVLVLSLQSGHHLMVESLRAGAAGFVSKDRAADNIVEAVRAVQRGHRFFPTPVDLS